MKREVLTADEFRAQAPKTAKRHKYGAKKTEVDGITFDSKREAVRYTQLRHLQRMGRIDKLKLQPEFILQPAFVRQDGKKVRAIKYVADFAYVEVRGGTGLLVIEDVKGMETPVFKLKQKLFWYAYPHAELRIVR